MSVYSESGDLCELIAISRGYLYYYTGTIKRPRQDRKQAALTETLEQADEITDIDRVVKCWIDTADKNMETFS